MKSGEASPAGEWNRPAAVAGRFYPKTARELNQLLTQYLPPFDQPLQSPVAVFAPHAGYIYSGRIAGELYRRIRVPDRVILLCPNHTGAGKRIAVWARGSWETPLGRVPVDEALAQRFIQAMGGEAQADRDAHRAEHAIEVHLPFLQRIHPTVRIVPIVLGPLRWEAVERVGRALGRVLTEEPAGSILIVASTDMSHYLSADEAAAADRPALEAVRQLDPDGLYRTVVAEDISMCGFIPTAAAWVAARDLGAKGADLVSYGHSGETTGDSRQVVAYAAGLAHP